MADSTPVPALPTLPDYAPVPPSAFGPALNEQGYYVGRVERNLSGSPTARTRRPSSPRRDGVVLFDAPPTIGHNLQRAVDEIAQRERREQPGHLPGLHRITTPTTPARRTCSARTSSGSGTRRPGDSCSGTTIRRGPRRRRRSGRRTLEIGGERVELAFHGANHSPDNSVIHFPDHDTLMLVDIVNPGWVPVYVLNLTDDIPGYIASPPRR